MTQAFVSADEIADVVSNDDEKEVRVISKGGILVLHRRNIEVLGDYPAHSFNAFRVATTRFRVPFMTLKLEIGRDRQSLDVVGYEEDDQEITRYPLAACPKDLRTSASFQLKLKHANEILAGWWT